jgi:hypothetical protein
LVTILAEEASKLASQFLNVCIRAVDYCPPMDVTFGDYLRAMITADFDLVPEDRWAYREALIDGFRLRGIYPFDVKNLSEDALLWRGPELRLPKIKRLAFGELHFGGDPASPASAEELARQAAHLGEFVTKREYMEEFGIIAPDDGRLRGDRAMLPRVESIRTARRIGPDGEIIFDLVAEVAQRRYVKQRPGESSVDFFGGSTVLIGPDGTIRYVIRKSILSESRLKTQIEYVSGAGQRYWKMIDGQKAPLDNAFKMLHQKPPRRRGRSAR